MTLADLCVRRDHSIRDVMVCIDRSGKGVALVVDGEQRLVDLITDGDLRRAILSGIDLGAGVEQVLAHKRLAAQQEQPARPYPVTAGVGTSRDELLHLMQQYGLRHIPLLDDAGRPVEVVFLSDLAAPREGPTQAVVMAGGLGVRLRPLTDKLPKPMLQVSGQPLLERIIEQLRRAGIRRVSVATYYMKDLIAKHFGSGEDFGLSISYLEEDEPFGTAGALGLLAPWGEPLLVINGDILTRLDFEAMLDFHREHDAVMTVGVRQYDLNVPYGVVETDENKVVRVVEKPQYRYFINAGIYLLSPEVRRHIPTGQRDEMPDLINRLVGEGLRVVSFPIFEYWLDIGRVEDYERGQRDAEGWTS